MGTMNITEKGAKTRLNSGKSKADSRPIELSQSQLEKINSAIVKAVLEEAKDDKAEWISFSRD